MATVDASAARGDGRSKRAQEQRDKRRLQILRAAARVFATKGYEAGSIADIIEAAGIARGTFYLHFESKQAIVSELLEELLDALDRAVVRVDVESPVSPYDQLLENLIRILDVLIEEVDTTRILLDGSHADELVPRVRTFWDRSASMLVSALEIGRSIGLVRPAIDVPVVTRAILGGLKEVVRALVLDEPADARKREIAEKLLDYHLFGVLERTTSGLTPQSANVVSPARRG